MQKSNLETSRRIVESFNLDLIVEENPQYAIPSRSLQEIIFTIYFNLIYFRGRRRSHDHQEFEQHKVREEWCTENEARRLFI